jgi:hypothetical protein
MQRLLVVTLLACMSYGCSGGGIKIGGVTVWGRRGSGEREVVHPKIRLDESELSRGVASGTSTVQGQAFLKTVGGDVKYAAGDLIYLCPKGVGMYLIEAASMRREYGEVDYDKRADQACRSMKGDGQGHFRFTGVAAGEYTLATWVVWGIPTGSTTIGGVTKGIAASWTFLSYGATGGLTTGNVTVREGETADVIVNEISVMAE